ncbi:MAG: extracellular solute-binding protein [Phycisphaerae bacterium]
MPAGVTLSRIVRHGSLAIVLILGAWLLWPDREEADSAPVEGSPAQARGRKYFIKFSPGRAYFPDSHPFGLGKPLQGLKKVIKAYEARFGDTRVEVISTPGVREYLVTQLAGGQAPDIINVNVEDVWTDVHKGWYVPLDCFLEAPNPFVVEKRDANLPGSKQWWDMFRYQAISRGKAAPDGKNYCITFDMVETGIYYNKDIFAELSLGVPETWEELLDTLRKIKASGRTPLVMHMGAYHDWLMDLMFDQLYYDLLPGIDLLKDPVREPYLQGYLDWDELAFLHAKGFFNRDDRRYVQIWRLMRQLRDYTNQDLVSTDTIREFVMQRAAMIWYASHLSYRLSGDKDLGFNWGVFYLPRLTKTTSPFASGQEMCVIGGAATQLEVTNRAVSDTDPSLPMAERIRRSEKLKRVIALLQFMCLPEQNARIVNEYPAFVPNIVGVKALPILRPFEKILNRRYTTTKWVFTFDLRFSEIQQRMLMLYLTDGIDLAGFLDWQEQNLSQACANLRRRKPMDTDRLERAWRAQAAARAAMDALPPRVRQEPAR